MPKLNLLRFTFCFFAYFFLQSPLISQSAVPEWIRLSNSRVTASDMGRAICEDAFGNVLVLGDIKQSSPSGTEALLQKYDSNGVLLWGAGYHNPFRKMDQTVDVAVDSSNNVYALINSYPTSDSNQDILLLKYNPNGQVIWQVVYNGIGTGTDRSVELHVEPGGTSTIFGDSENASGIHEMLVVRYDPGGSLIYQNRRIDSLNFFQQAKDMVVGPNGDVFVTGNLTGNGSDDIALYQVAPSGNIVWDTTYSRRLLNAGTIGSVEIDLLNSGNPVLLTAESNAFEVEFRLLAFDLNGNEIAGNAVLLQNSAVQPYAMGVGPDGNVYVSYASLDINFLPERHLWKCDSGLQTHWDRAIDYTYSVFSVPHTLKFLPNGNLALAGIRDMDSAYVPQAYQLMVMELDTAGTKVREDVSNGPGNTSDFLSGFAVAGNGTVLLTGQVITNTTDPDLFTAKMDLASSNDWFQKTGRKVNGRDNLIALKRDGNGNIYLGGQAQLTSSSVTGFHLAKFDPAGNTLLDTTYFAPNGLSFWPTGMDVDPAGNIAMTAHGSFTTSDQGWYLYHFDANGQVLWWDTLMTHVSGIHYTAREVAFDGAGSIYMTANDKFAFNKTAWHIAKYNAASGNRIWDQRLLPLNPGSNYGFTDLTTLIPDGSDVWVAGQLDGNMAYRKLDQNGGLIGSLEYFAATSNSNIDFEIDPSGNPVFFGRADNATVGGYHWGTFKFDPTGNLLWSDQIPGNVIAYAQPEDVETDAAGNIYVCGRTGGYKYSVGKYDASGNLIWKQDYGTGNNTQRIGAWALLPTPGGGMVSCGRNGMLNAQMRVVNTNPGGWANWVYDFPPAGTFRESGGLAMVRGLGGELYVAGYADGDTTRQDLLLIKFDQATGAEEGIGVVNLHLYPNPARDKINVEWVGFPESVECRMQIIDLSGRVLSERLNQTGRFPVDISALRPGMYFMRLENDLGMKAQAKFLVR